MQLQNLVEFFTSGTGLFRNVKVVDRQGPFEMQQYILGEGELVESVKLDVHDPTYYHARIEQGPARGSGGGQVVRRLFHGLGFAEPGELAVAVP